MPRKLGGKPSVNGVDPFVEPALKYVGRLGVMSGPVPIQVSHRPYVRPERDRPLGAEGKDLRGERPQRQTQPPEPLKKKKG